MKKKVLLTSIMTIALCLCLIAGSTFALFTSTSKVDISMTAGKVEMSANVDALTLYSAEKVAGTTETAKMYDENGKGYYYKEVENFTNGGTATFAGDVLTMDKVTPGDKVEFTITGANTSDVATQYRYIIECTEGYTLMGGLVVTVNGNAYTSLASYTSEWAPLAAGVDITPVTVSIELPITAGNAYQGETTAISVTVEAVQGNADTEGGETVEYLNPVKTAEELAAALTQNEKNIVVSLDADIAYTVQDHGFDYAMGGDVTELITINGNGHTLTFNNLSDDNNDIKTNNGAKLVINNTKLTNNIDVNVAKAWNAHDIIFACDVELNKVTSDRALAFKADTSLNDVTIEDAATEYDVYALWIQANGQNVTIDGLTVNADRAIKIDEQYVTAAKVNLSVANATFNTNEKAAIMVKSAAGAAITLYNVDIANTGDDTNAVCVDEDAAASYDLVTVNGGSKVQE